MAGCLLLIFLTACDLSANLPPVPTVLPATTVPSQATPVMPEDACTLLAKAEVESALGQPVMIVKGKSKVIAAIGSTNSCTYASKTFAVILDIGQSSAARGSGQLKQLQSDYAVAIISDGQAKPVSGLGDSALWIDNGKNAGGYAFTNYPFVLSVVVGGEISTPVSYQSGLMKLALLASSRLPH
jgi:archaellum component FlaG (FlaF/FlaG flagellin family)